MGRKPNGAHSATSMLRWTQSLTQMLRVVAASMISKTASGRPPYRTGIAA